MKIERLKILKEKRMKENVKTRKDIELNGRGFFFFFFWMAGNQEEQQTLKERRNRETRT